MGKSETEMINELRNLGYKYVNTVTIFKQKALDPIVVKIILKWLPSIYSEDIRIGHTLVRSLITAKEPFDPKILLELFEYSELNFSLKSGIAFTLILAKTGDISKWLRNQLLNKEYSIERSSFISGLSDRGGFAATRELMSFLQQIFSKYHDEEVLKLFKKYGDKNDFLFLRRMANETKDVKLAKKIMKLLAWYEEKK